VKAVALLVRPDQALLRKRSLQYLAILFASDKLNQPDEAETVVRRLIAIEPADIGSYFALLKIYEGADRMAEAEAVLGEAQAAAPDRIEVWTQTAQYFNRKGDFDRSMAAFHRLTQIEPQNPQHFYQLAVFYEEKVRKDFALGPQQASDYLARGIAAVDKALALRPEYFEALTYKNLLLRQRARLETDPARQQVLIDAADQLQRQAIDVRNRQTRGQRRP
jgi:predicted Zn-dependent protease